MYVTRRDFHKILVSPSSLAQKKRRHATRLRNPVDPNQFILGKTNIHPSAKQLMAEIPD
jgi:hypothetical protein